MVLTWVSFFVVALFSSCLIVAPAAAARSRNEVINQCHSNGTETMCIGYNSHDADSRNDCSPAPETCFFAFASISKPPGGGDGFLVTLVGKGAGWVGLAFSDDESQVMKADNLGVVCVNRINPPVRILRIQERDTSGRQTGQKLPFEFDDSSLADSVRNPIVTYSDGWMICEFVLSAKPRHSTKTLDLGGTMYKLALAGHETMGLDAGNPNQPQYHQRRGSSGKKVDVFQKVNGATTLGKGAAPVVTMGLSLVLMALVSKIVL